MQYNIGSIGKSFADDDGRRQTRLNQLREIAAYTIPSILPPLNLLETEKLEQTYQSIGSRGIANLEGRLLTSLFPTGTFWARFVPSEVVRQEPTANEQVESIYTGQTVTRLQAFEERLFLRELSIQRFLDGTNYRNAMRLALRSNLIVGSSLTKMTGDARFKTFREDQYVLCRDPDEELVYLITKETKDPLYLPDGVLAKVGLAVADLESKPAHDRNIDVYTRAKKQRDGGWLIEQEINGIVAVESQEAVSPYIVGAYDLISGEHYGRSFAELNMGDLRSINGLSRAALGIAACMSRILVILDDTTGTTRKKDLEEKEDGEIVFGRVQNGVAADVAFLQANKFGDLQGVMAVSNRVEERLSKAMLVESEIQPTGDRVTAFQVARLAQELEGALGGVYAAVAERLQRPLLDRVLHHMEANKILKPLPKQAIHVQTLTGLEALSRERDLQKYQLLNEMASRNPALLQQLDLGAIARQFIRLIEIDPTGIVKSRERVEQEQRAAAMAQLQQAASEKAIETAGNIAEQQALAPQAAA